MEGPRESGDFFTSQSNRAMVLLRASSLENKFYSLSLEIHKLNTSNCSKIGWKAANIGDNRMWVSKSNFLFELY